MRPLLLLAGLGACGVEGDGIQAPRRVRSDGPRVELRASDADVTYSGAPRGTGLGWEVAAVGDVDGDGRADVAASAPSWPAQEQDTTGRVWLLRAGPERVPDVALGPPDYQGAPGDHLGFSLAAAGDVDRDGGLDFAMGAIGRDRGGEDVGLLVVAGAPLRATGRESQDFLGSGLAPGGDLDDDGFDEVLTGAMLANGADYDVGQIAVYSGGGAPGRVPLPDAVFAGTMPHGGLGDLHSFAAVDLDGDGWREVAAAAWDFRGAPFHDDVYVFANEGGFSGKIPLDDATLRYTGESWLYGYTTVASAGDVDGDGLEDLLVGRATPLRHQGAITYVVRGEDPLARGARDILDARHAELVGDAEDGWQGLGAGDLDGDGLADVVIGAPDNGGLAEDGGAVSVFYGAGLHGAVPVADADVRIFGDRDGDRAGHSVTTADHDGDGVADLVIGGFGRDGQSGAVWVFLGSGL